MKLAEDTYRTAVAQHQAGNSQQAAGMYAAILEQSPGHHGAWHLLGVVYQQQGDLERAEAHIRKAIALNVSKAIYHNNLGVVLRAQGRLPEAIGEYRRALEINPHYADAHSNLAVALHEQKQYEAAFRSFRPPSGSSRPTPMHYTTSATCTRTLAAASRRFPCTGRRSISNRTGRTFTTTWEMPSWQNVARRRRANASDNDMSELEIEAVDPTAAERVTGPDSGTVRFTRSGQGDMSNPLEVHFDVGGSATPGERPGHERQRL